MWRRGWERREFSLEPGGTPTLEAGEVCNEGWEGAVREVGGQPAVGGVTESTEGARPGSLLFVLGELRRYVLRSSWEDEKECII